MSAPPRAEAAGRLISFRASPEEIRGYEESAETEGCESRSEWIRQALRDRTRIAAVMAKVAGED